MAKKKVAAKKSTNNKKPVKTAKPAKKTVKKAAKPSAKKIVKKAKPAKTAKPAVKAKSKKVMKAASKAKAPAKSKTPVKKAVKAAKTTKVSKSVAKKAAAPKAIAKPMVSAALVRPTVPAKKKLDLTNFVTPLDDRLMVQLSEMERMTPGGLFIPDTVADMSGNLHGVVVAVGRGHFSKKGHLQPMDVKVGDKVVFAQHSGSKIKIQNEDLIILRESDVMGVVTK